MTSLENQQERVARCRAGVETWVAKTGLHSSVPTLTPSPLSIAGGEF